MPRYREKGGMFNLILSANAINIKKGFLTVPMSREFSKLHGGKQVKIPFPKRLEGKTIKEIRICPIYNGVYFKIQYCYLQEEEPQDVSVDKVLAIDIGLENLATCVTNTGTAFIMDGRKLKSINQYWNKQKAYYQGIANKQGQKKTHRLYVLTRKRNHRTQDYIRKVAPLHHQLLHGTPYRHHRLRLQWRFQAQHESWEDYQSAVHANSLWQSA